MPSTCAEPAVPCLDLGHIEAYLGDRPVFRDLSLRVRPGEHTVVLGPNGAGKSALIRLLTREIYPVVKPGSWLRLFGRSTINLWELRSRIGVVSQSLQDAYIAAVPAADVVLSGFFGSVGIGRSQTAGPQQRQRVRRLLAEFDLADAATTRFGHLSDGQRRRLLLARALVHRPEMLLLDEPTNALDLKARHGLLATLRRLARSGTTLLLVTHRIEEIIPEMRRCLLLRDGRVLAQGPVAQMLRDDLISELFGTPVRVVHADGYHQVLPGRRIDGSGET